MPPIRLDQINLIVGDVPASRAFSRLGPDFGRLGRPGSGREPATSRPSAARRSRASTLDLDSQAFAGKWNHGWPGGLARCSGSWSTARAVVDDLVAALKADGVPVQQEP